MEFVLKEALPVLGSTPDVLRAMLAGLSPAWCRATDGPGSWSPYDVVGHLIHGEKTDWMPRVEHLLQYGEAVPFPVFEREAMLTASQESSLLALLDEFADLRARSLNSLRELALSDDDLLRHGKHPELGVITLGQHLATWVAHDLSHIGQIVRMMSRQYSAAVGPWRAYLPILGPA